MKLRPSLLLAAPLLFGLWTAPHGWAADVTLTQAAPPASYKPAARAVDLLGITPGMPPEKVAAVLKDLLGPVRTYQENLGLEDRGVAVATQAFVTRMVAEKDGDQVTVWFGTPTTGNGVVEVSRQTNIFDPKRAPDARQVRAELIAKYGPPASDQPAVGSSEVAVLAWSYNGDKLSPCPRSACRADVSEGLDVRNMAAYQHAVATGHQLIIVATILTSTDDANRAASVVVTVSDMATKQRTLELAIQQMKAAIAAAVSKGRGKERG